MADQKTVVRDEDDVLQPVRLFSTWMKFMGAGEADPQIAAEFKAMIEGVRADAKRRSRKSKGKLKLTIDLSSTPEGVLEVDWDVDTKIPKPPRRASLAFITDSGKLTFNDPKQLKLGFIREVTNDNTESPREAAAGEERPVIEA